MSSEDNRISHILLVDDESSVLFALKLVLQAMGFKVTDFSLPLEAIAYLAEGGECDMCICDLRMPKMNGLQVLTEMKSLRRELIFVLMSAHAQRDEAAQAKDLGAAGFLSKPFTPDQLKDLVAEISGQKEQA
ncbi:MAG: response regulator [Deltaproteobacteria bacterium]|nr:response regulator [Deltaproteobacteria bacterium]